MIVTIVMVTTMTAATTATTLTTYPANASYEPWSLWGRLHSDNSRSTRILNLRIHPGAGIFGSIVILKTVPQKIPESLPPPSSPPPIPTAHSKAATTPVAWTLGQPLVEVPMAPPRVSVSVQYKDDRRWHGRPLIMVAT